jgi:hypothetical protein
MGSAAFLLFLGPSLEPLAPLTELTVDLARVVRLDEGSLVMVESGGTWTGKEGEEPLERMVVVGCEEDWSGSWPRDLRSKRRRSFSARRFWLSILS